MSIPVLAGTTIYKLGRARRGLVTAPGFIPVFLTTPWMFLYFTSHACNNSLILWGQLWTYVTG